MKQVIWIAFGGAIGAILRYLTAVGINLLMPLNFPLGTLVVNILGCFIIGIVFASLNQLPNFESTLKPFLVIGILGGFTTFSSYAMELLQLTQTQQFGKALFYFSLSNFGGFAAAWLGFKTFSA
jgi:CrcB protein